MNRHISGLAIAAMWWSQSAAAQTAPAPAAPPAPATPPAQAAPTQPPAAQAPVEGTAPVAAPDANAGLRDEVTAQRADLDEQDARIMELEKQLKAQAAAAAQAKAEVAKPPPPPTPEEENDRLKVVAYAQAQYETHQDSEDQQLPGGALLNQNRFVLRRARVKLLRDWKYGGAMIEFDANTVRGAAIGIQHAEVSLAYRNQDFTPLVSFTLGLFDNPFGREVVESPRERPFMERSFGSRAFFPGEPDLGARIAGQWSFLRYSVAVVNGQPIGDRTGFVLQDPNNHKDVLGRIGIATEARPNVRITGGVSVLNGRGYRPGSDATKNTTTWTDANENGQIDLGEVQGTPGRAATAAQNFDRWALGADIGVQVESRFGKSSLFAEISAGSNMDRNVFIADPITASFDQRELGYYVSLVQELRQGPIVGFRYDHYDPNSDFLDRQRGKLVPTSEAVNTFSPLIGFQVPKRARLILQYDIIRDAMARNAAGVPVDKENNTLTLRLQGEL